MWKFPPEPSTNDTMNIFKEMMERKFSFILKLIQNYSNSIIWIDTSVNLNKAPNFC